jgi:hypothetical protein
MVYDGYAPVTTILMQTRYLSSLLVLAAASQSFGQNLLTNGDLELSVPNSGTGNGWTAFNNDGAGGWRSTGGNPNGTFILNDNGNPSTNPTIEQTVSGLTVGTFYRVSGDYTIGNSVQPTNFDFGVGIAGQQWEYTIPTSGWNHFSQVFQATSTSVLLVLTGERHGDSDPRIDNIDLRLEPVPEPASLAILGFGALLALRSRRR